MKTSHPNPLATPPIPQVKERMWHRSGPETLIALRAIIVDGMALRVLGLRQEDDPLLVDLVEAARAHWLKSYQEVQSSAAKYGYHQPMVYEPSSADNLAWPVEVA